MKEYLEQVLNQVDTVPVRGRSRKIKWDTETLKCYINTIIIYNYTQEFFNVIQNFTGKGEG